MADNFIPKPELEKAILNGELLKHIEKVEFDRLKELGSLLAVLHNEKSVDCLATFEETVSKNVTNKIETRLGYVLESFLAAVEETSERITLFIHKIHGRMPDFSAHGIVKGFEKWAVNNSNQINEVVTIIQNEEYDSAFLSALLLTLRDDSPKTALKKTIGFTRENRPVIKRQSIYTLGTFVASDAKESASIENRLAELLASECAETQCLAISATVRSLENQNRRSPRLVEQLELLAEKPDSKVRRELILGFVYHRNAYSSSLTNKVIELMKTVPKHCTETLQAVDIALYQMDLDKDRITIFDILSASLGQKNAAPSFKDFQSFCHKARDTAHEVLGWYVIAWLLKGEYKICKQLESLFPAMDQNAYNFTLDKFKLSDEEIIYLVHKTYAYLIFNHGPAVSLFCTFLIEVKLSNRKKIEEEIATFWLRNYPADLKLFNENLERYPRKGLKASFNRIRKHLADYERPLRTLPDNLALSPSTEERQIQNELERQRSKEITRSAYEASILGSLVQKSTILYGRSSVSYIHSGDSKKPQRQVIPLQSHGVSIKFPRMDILYPARFNYLVYQFRSEKRPK